MQNGFTPLLTAAQGGHSDIVQYLLANGSSVKERTNVSTIAQSALGQLDFPHCCTFAHCTKTLHIPLYILWIPLDSFSFGTVSCALIREVFLFRISYCMHHYVTGTDPKGF